MITPDELADRLTPPMSTGPAYAAQLAVAHDGLHLAERILDATPRGRMQDLAVDAVARAVHAAFAALDPGYTLPVTDPAPSGALEVPRGHPDPDAGLDPVLILDVGVWRLGIRTSRMHPFTRLVGLVISEACGVTGYIADANQPTLTDLSEQTGLQLHQLHGHLHDLVSQHWISRHTSADHGVRRSRFQLRLPNSR